MFLTTNLSDNFDKAFSRRLLYKLEVKAPSNEVRKKILTKVFDDIYPYLSYCTRYYNDYNPSRGSIYKAAIGYWGKVTNITQTINYVSVEYIENGKIGLVNMDYSFFSIKDQVQKYIKNLSLRVQLDDDNNIIEIYELSRDK